MKTFRIRNINRIIATGLAFIVQFMLYLGILNIFNDYSNWFYGLSIAISVFAVLWIINNDSNPSYKIAWILLIMLAPVFGGVFYLEFGNNRMGKKEKKSMRKIEEATGVHLPQEPKIIDEMLSKHKVVALQVKYIQDYGGYPPARNSQIEYYPIGEQYFESLKKELLTAKHFILLEYFIIDQGKMWDEILDILKKKVLEGVDVRVIYDDFGCMLTLPVHYKAELESFGIKCKIFNRFTPVFSFLYNTRDHRKIAVIDNSTAFTGGINLADEYINAYVKYGHWKDVGVKVCGDAVWHFTVMFLSMWDYLAKSDTDYQAFRLEGSSVNTGEATGIVQPFSDNPLDTEPVGQNVYLNLISRAEDYIYISTPYLVIDEGMINALTNAAKSGVDVRIMTPHIPDKWYVHAVTRSYYDKLVKSGVRIFEYTPGFMHSKSFVVDDIYGVIGTINMDYRSLYLHFECGVWTYKSGIELDLKRDFLETQDKCMEITEETLKQVGYPKAFLRMILKVFAPLM